MISLQVGDCWVWSLIIFLVSKVLSQLGLDPRPKWGGFPPYYSYRGETTDVRAPSSGSSGATPLKDFFYEKFLVKYCNFVVNLDHSLSHKSDCRSYDNLSVFFPGDKTVRE